MKWLHAKRANQLIVLLLVLITIAGYFTQKLLYPPSLRMDVDADGTFQLGFYDLMSSHAEIYDSRVRTVHGTVLSTITSRDDNQFMLTGKFTQTEILDGKRYFYLTPVYYSRSESGLMIDGMVDLLMHNRFWMMSLEFDSQPLIVGKNGSIFIYPLKNNG